MECDATKYPPRAVHNDSPNEIESPSSGTATSRLPKLPPCRVCGNRASGLHYGVNTCEGCKGFFRRTLAKGLEYTCIGNSGQCHIIPKKRNTCQACRFKKCLDVGMSKNAIKTGRYTHSKRAQDITEIKTLENQGHYEPLSGDRKSRHKTFQNVTSSSSLNGTVHLTNSSIHSHNVKPKEIQNTVDLATTSETNIVDKISSSSDETRAKSRSSTSKTVVEEPIPLDQENSELLSELLGAQDDFVFENLDSFLDEEKMSQAQKEYSDKLDSSSMKHKELTEEEKLKAEQDESYRMTEELAALVNTELKRCIRFVKKVPGWKDINMEDQINLIKEAQVEFWLLGHHQCLNAKLGVFTGEFNATLEQSKAIYDDKYLELIFRNAESFKSLRLSKEEVAILRVITLTFTDRGPLKDAQKVESVHWRMIDCLKCYYASLGINFNRRFAHVIDKLTEARNVTDAFNKLTRNVIRCWSVMKKYPLLEEFYSPPQYRANFPELEDV